MLRSLRIFAEFVAAFAGVLMLVMVLVVWRLSSSPISSSFLTPYIERAVERVIPDARAQIEHTLLTWDNADHSLALHADHFVIRDARGQIIAEVPRLDIRLSLLGFVVGRFLPTELTVDHPQIKLNLRKDGKLYFASLSTASDESDVKEDSRDVLRSALKNLTQAYAMRHLSIFRAVVAVHDEKTNADWSVSLPELSLQRTFNQLVGMAKIEVSQNDQVALLDLRYAYDANKKLHRVNTRFHSIMPSQLVGGHPENLGFDLAAMLAVPLSGEIEAAFDRDLSLADGTATLHGGAGVLNIPALWDKPRTIDSMDVEASYDKEASKLDIPTASFDFHGAKLELAGTGHAPRDAKKYDLDFDFTARLGSWPMDSFGDLWPKPLIPDVRDWMTQNLSKGRYDKGEAKFSGSLAWNDLADLTITSGSGAVFASGGDVAYLDGMPHVEGVGAEADFDLSKVTIQIGQGHLGNLQVLPFALTMTGLENDTQYIDIPLKLAGPIPEILKLIDHPPLRYAQMVGLSADAVTGSATGTVDLHFPLIKTLATKDIDVKADANLSNVASSRLIEGVDLSQGDLAFALDRNGLTVKGPLTVNAIPLKIMAQQAFHQIRGKVFRSAVLSGTVKDDQWKALGLDLGPGAHGSALVNVQMTQPNKAETLFNGSVDLTGSDLRVDILNWKKPLGAAAILQFAAKREEGQDIDVTSIALRGPQTLIKGQASISAQGEIKSAKFDPFVIGRTDATISFDQSDDGALRFEARGAALDATGMMGEKAPAHADPRPKDYAIDVAKLYTGADSFIAKAQGFASRDDQGWSAIGLQGFADGAHPFTIDLTPQPNGQRVFSAYCDDFGTFLKGFGFTDTVKGGELKVAGGSAPDNPRAIVGTIKISSFSVGQLPALVLLLNATSPFGFAGLVTDSASFDKVKGWFRWSDDSIELSHVNMAGTSAGMNIDGKVDMNSGAANLWGTLVPFSTMNRVLESIPVLGDILTGGNGGGVLAVSYTIKGKLSDPNVSVNPVSLLTPGFLRNLFFGGDDAGAPDAEPDKIQPESQPVDGKNAKLR